MIFKNQHPALSFSQLAVKQGWEKAGRESLITSFVSHQWFWGGLVPARTSRCAQLMLSLSCFYISPELLVQLWVCQRLSLAFLSLQGVLRAFSFPQTWVLWSLQTSTWSKQNSEEQLRAVKFFLFAKVRRYNCQEATVLSPSRGARDMETSALSKSKHNPDVLELFLGVFPGLLPWL